MSSKFSPIVGRYVHVTVKGVEYRVYFEESGQGTPVLFQHTAGSDGRQWRHLLESPELTSRFRFVAYDLPYHGKSLPPLGNPWWSERYSLNQSFLLDFVGAMVEALEMEKPIYVGCSMGATSPPTSRSCGRACSGLWSPSKAASPPTIPSRSLNIYRIPGPRTIPRRR